MAKTILKFIGGLNKDRIGANCQVIEHTNDKGQVCRIMIDDGSLFVPYGTEFSAAYPNVEKYFDRTDLKTQNNLSAPEPVDALFITHTHQDHIGALIACVRMGYRLPPIYTSEYTGHVIRLSFSREGVKIPEIRRVKEYNEIKLKDVEVTPFYVGHSAVDSMGFTVRTFSNDKPYARVIDYGDFLTLEQMPLGHGFDKNKHLEDLRKKPAPFTLAELDSTSTTKTKRKRIGFEKAVENTYCVCQENADRSIIVSPVLSGSWNNVAIDLEVAKRLGTKVFFEGQGLKTPKDALKLSGYDKYDDVMYHGSVHDYLADKNIKRKYIICTGAFVQGLDEYMNNVSQTPFSPIYMSSLTKMALGMHPDFQVSSDYLFITRQRDVESIIGDLGMQARHLLAAQGAKIVTTPCGKSQTHFEEVMMQDPNHIDPQSLRELLEDIDAVVDHLTVLPIHGTTEQRQATQDIAQVMDICSYMSYNGDHFEISPQGLKKIEKNEEDEANTFFALKKVFKGMDGREDIPFEGISEYWLIDENYRGIEKLCEVSNVVQTGPKSHSSGKHIDVEALENLPQGEKISPYTHKPSLRKVKKAGKKRTFPQKQRD